MYIRIKTILIFCMALLSLLTGRSQNLSRVEYFFDTDPGFGQGMQVAIPADSLLVNFVFHVDLSALSTGMHTLFLRTQDVLGRWSVTNQQFVYKFAPLTTAGATMVNKLEYFFDTDPGYGNGVDVPVGADSNLNGFLFNADISQLSTGLHAMYIRSRDAAGRWSVSNQQFVYKFVPLTTAGATMVNKLEYFFDTDPGYGNGVNVPVGADSNLNGFLFNADISLLSTGLHAMHIRSRDAAGRWSVSNQQFVYKFAPLTTAGATMVNKLEYFFDTDPGYGNGVDVPVGADSNLNGFLFNADISMLSTGLHAMYIRSRDAAGRWSVSNQQFVYKFAPLTTAGATMVNKLEYFFDTDPGYGNGVDVPVGADSNLNGFLFNADISQLSTGLHAMYIRSRDVTGRWSVTNQQFVYKFAPLTTAGATMVNKLEYFFDTDPGYGNGVDVPVGADSNLNGFLFNADISMLSTGLHAMYIRSRDVTGRWSVSNQQFVYKFAPLTTAGATMVNKLEYFFDSDPGYGNGVDVPVGADSNLNGFLFNADISQLSTGLHAMYIRSRDAAGRWSVTNQQFVYKFAPLTTAGATMVNKLEYFFDTDPGYGNGVDVPVGADSNLNGFLFNADISQLSTGLHAMYIRSRDAAGRWSVTNQQFVYKFAPLNNNILPAITRIEYFVDADPGPGNGTALPIVADTLLSNIAFFLDTTGLSYGSHVLSVRSLDANGKWSLVNTTRFSRDNLKLFLQGYYLGAGLMAPVLLQQGAANDPGLTDTIEIELRNPSWPYALKEKTKALLRTDGTVACTFMNVQGSYYIVVKHRNSIHTWSSAPVAIGNFTTTYDFSTAANKAYGQNMKSMGNGVWAIYSGDLDRDENIDLIDASFLEEDIEDFLFGYYASDINGDGNVDLLDSPVVEQNIKQFIYSIHP